MLRLRWILGILILLSVLFLGVVLWKHVRNQSVQEVLKALPQHIDLALDQLNYTQTENGKKRWTLKADRAEYLRDSSLLELTAVDLLFFDAGAAGDLTLRADFGQLQEETRQVDIHGNVVITTTRDESLQTEKLHYDDQVRQISTDLPFQYRSPQMTLNGVGLLVDLDKNTLFVEKNVTLRILPKKENSGEK